jgi:hypothetical protein
MKDADTYTKETAKISQPKPWGYLSLARLLAMSSRSATFKSKAD